MFTLLWAFFFFFLFFNVASFQVWVLLPAVHNWYLSCLSEGWCYPKEMPKKAPTPCLSCDFGDWAALTAHCGAGWHTTSASAGLVQGWKGKQLTESSWAQSQCLQPNKSVSAIPPVSIIHSLSLLGAHFPLLLEQERSNELKRSKANPDFLNLLYLAVSLPSLSNLNDKPWRVVWYDGRHACSGCSGCKGILGRWASPLPPSVEGLML